MKLLVTFGVGIQPFLYDDGSYFIPRNLYISDSLVSRSDTVFTSATADILQNSSLARKKKTTIILASAVSMNIMCGISKIHHRKSTCHRAVLDREKRARFDHKQRPPLLRGVGMDLNLLVASSPGPSQLHIHRPLID